MESRFPVKEFTLKRKKPRQLSSHRDEGNAVRVARYRLVVTGWVEGVTRDQVLWGSISSWKVFFWGTGLILGGYMAFPPGRTPKYLKKKCLPVNL